MVGRAQIELRELALTIRHGARYAVGVEPHTARAEAGSGTESAYGYLQILSVILPILDRSTGHSSQ